MYMQEYMHVPFSITLFINLFLQGPEIGYRMHLTSVYIPLKIHFRPLLLSPYVFRRGLCGYLANKEKKREQEIAN